MGSTCIVSSDFIYFISLNANMCLFIPVRNNASATETMRRSYKRAIIMIFFKNGLTELYAMYSVTLNY